MNMLPIFAILCATTLTTSCASMTAQGGETEAERCYQLGKALPTRSHADTERTKDEIQHIYAVFSLACPRHAQLVPR